MSEGREKKHILLIDDEASLREEVSEWLTLEDYEVTSAANGLEGLQVAFRHTPDLVICDITMPAMDGYGVLLELRSNPSTAAVPFIFVTARTSHDDIRKGMYMGADDYITKPFTVQELLQSVSSQLEKKERQEQIRQADIEQWKSAFEDEREQRLLKARLVAMFSHDFRNPLSTIAASLSIMHAFDDRLDPERRQKHLNRALASVKQLTQMLDDMLVASQLDTGHLQFEPEATDVTDFLQQIVNDFQFIHSEKHTLLFHSEIAAPISLDSRLLRQIVANLLSNAVKYSPRGGRIWVELAQEGQQLLLTIRDEGIGIPDSEQADLFETFRRASNVGNVAGTGLGLAIIKQAVDLHQGSVQLESQLGAGTKVTVKLPSSAG